MRSYKFLAFFMASLVLITSFVMLPSFKVKASGNSNYQDLLRNNSSFASSFAAAVSNLNSEEQALFQNAYWHFDSVYFSAGKILADVSPDNTEVGQMAVSVLKKCLFFRIKVTDCSCKT